MAKNARTASLRPGAGTWTFVAQRASALVLLMISPWFALAVSLAAQGGYDGLLSFFASPINGAATAALVLAGCWHMQIGMHEIIEDYIHKPSTKALLSSLNTAVAAFGALAGVGGIAKIMFGV